jgi:NAD(P)-dependent dehydrogenase (short-subunit alcohol dehydrogenase family)
MLDSMNRRTVVITGSSGGIGKVMAMRFAQAGDNVVINGRDPEKCQAAALEISRAGGSAAACAADVRHRPEAERLADFAAARFGHIDVLIANAGVVKMGSFLDYSEQDWRDSVELNLSAVVYSCQAAARRMVAHAAGGRILTVASIGANMGQFGFTGYGATKAGVLGLTRVMAVELAQYGITANCIVPGPVLNDMLLGVYGEDKLLERQRTIPLGRLAEAAEVAGLALYLSSAEARYLTGQSFVVDGGASAAGCYTMEVFRRAESRGRG